MNDSRVVLPWAQWALLSKPAPAQEQTAAMRRTGKINMAACISWLTWRWREKRRQQCVVRFCPAAHWRLLRYIISWTWSCNLKAAHRVAAFHNVAKVLPAFTGRQLNYVGMFRVRLPEDFVHFHERDWKDGVGSSLLMIRACMFGGDGDKTM